MNDVAHVASWYAATAAPSPRRPPLQGARRVDAVVIGGGFTGLSAALRIAQAGRSVALLEARRVGWGASGRNGGLLIPGHRREPGHLIAAFGPQDARRLWDFGLAACDSLTRTVSTHAIACDLTLSGHVYAAANRRHLGELARERDAIAGIFNDHAIEMLDRDGVAAHLPASPYPGGWRDPRGGHFHPLNYALGLARAAEAAGAVVHEASPVRALTTGRSIRVATGEGSVEAEIGVLASDAELTVLEPSLAGMIMPVSASIVATEPLGQRLDQNLPTRAAISNTRFVLDYFRPTADGRILFGGGEKYSPRPPADPEAFVRPFLERALPALAGVRLDYGWSGVVSITRTRNPVFGRRGGLVWAGGYSGHGAILAGFSGALAAEAALGLSDAFDLFSRFPQARFPGGPLARDPLYVAGMIYYALRDRLGV
jgi:gamma-glutamylputrescine oxidase